MATHRQRLVLTALLLGASAAGCNRFQPSSGPNAGGSEITVAEVDAGAIEAALKEHKGKVVVVDCWATWCAPCVKKFPHFVELQKKYGEKGLVCISLSMDKFGDPEDYRKEKVLKFLQEKGATFQNFIVADPTKDEKALHRVLGDFSLIPYMVMFDRNSRRIWTSDEGPKLDNKQLESKIESLLGESP